MTYREEILQQALSLPPADRAFVAAALEDSLARPTRWMRPALMRSAGTSCLLSCSDGRRHIEMAR